MGGYITGSANLVDFVRSFSSSFIFTTALPPSLTAGALTSLRLIVMAMREAHLAENAALLKQEHPKLKPVLPGLVTLFGVIVGDADLCRAAKLLLKSTLFMCSRSITQLFLGERNDCVSPQLRLIPRKILLTWCRRLIRCGES